MVSALEKRSAVRTKALLGTVPATFGEMQFLADLYVDSNFFTGTMLSFSLMKICFHVPTIAVRVLVTNTTY